MLCFGINGKFYSAKSVVRIGNTVIHKLTSIRGSLYACGRWKITGMWQKAEKPKVCKEMKRNGKN